MRLLKRNIIPVLGLWHPIKHLSEVVWRTFCLIFFMPVLFAQSPSDAVYVKPRFSFIVSWFSAFLQVWHYKLEKITEWDHQFTVKEDSSEEHQFACRVWHRFKTLHVIVIPTVL